MGILRDHSSFEPPQTGAQTMRLARVSTPPPPGEPSPVVSPGGSSASPGNAEAARSELQRRRDELAEQVTELHWDLGGLAYEMAIRDHFRLDVLVRRAALLQERDAELAEVERLLRMEQDGVAGECPNCSAPHSRGALYCWQCGTTLMERRASAVLADADAVADGASSAMDALLSGDGAPGAWAGPSVDDA